MNVALKGKVALVTGAGVRLGRAIAEGLAAQGCDLLLHCNRSKREAQAQARKIEALGRRAKVLQADLSKQKQVERLAREAEKAFGGVDILVNSAAIFWPTPLQKLNARELDIFLDINLKSPYLLSSIIGRQMKKRGRGAIINMACVSALRPWRDFIPYSVSKAGVVALTVGMAKLLAPQVRVNAVAPGTVLPPEKMPRKQIDDIKRRLPLKKLGSPDDIVAAVIYLATAEFVTGQLLCVDGGRSVI